MKNIAIVGCGYWGKNLVRNFHRIGALCGVCDSNAETLKRMNASYPDVALYGDMDRLLSDKSVQAVVIAAPAAEHYALVRKSLEHGKHVLVEKPFTTSYREALELAELAEKKKLVLMVGFTFIYNPAVRKVKEIIESKELGDIYYVYSRRLNLGIIRKDINAWWNLAPHDVSIILYWLGQEVAAVSGSGFSFIQKGIEDVVFGNIRFKSGAAAQIHVSWLDPNKTREMVVIGSKKMVIYDDVSSDRKVTIYDKGIDRFEDYQTFGQFQLIHRAGDVYIPKIDFKEPLEIEAQHFIDCVKSGGEPMTSARKALPSVKALEAVQESMKQGKWIDL